MDFVWITANHLIIIYVQVNIYQCLTTRVPDIWNKDSFTTHCCRCYPMFHGKPRNDWIIYLNIQNKHKTGGIADYVISQLHLLFEYEYSVNTYSLAYVRHMKFLGRDKETNMFILDRTNTFEIIHAHQIIRSVHLIPFFETTDCARKTLKNNSLPHIFEKYLFNHYSDHYVFFKFACI